MWFAFLGSVFAGALTAVQARLNGELGAELANGMLAALISFLAGLIVITAIIGFNTKSHTSVALMRQGLRNGRVPKWMLLAGVAGAFFITSQSLTVGVLGVSLFTLGVVGGQVITSVMLDHFGVGPSGKVAVSASRLIGASLAIFAVALAVWSRLAEVKDIWMIGFAILSGALIAWQAGVNGRISREVRSALVAALVNFVAGTIVLFAAALVSILILGWPGSWPTEIWLYLGGPLGVLFITLASGYVRIIGVLLLGMANIAGQLVGSLLLDVFAPVTRFSLSTGLVVGALLALAALVLAGWRQLTQSSTAPPAAG